MMMIDKRYSGGGEAATVAAQTHHLGALPSPLLNVVVAISVLTAATS